jgi:hypothetical protein
MPVTNLIARFIAWASVDLTPAIPSREESVFFDKECVRCEEEFDVPPEFVFDRRRAHYCEQCRRQF